MDSIILKAFISSLLLSLIFLHLLHINETYSHQTPMSRGVKSTHQTPSTNPPHKPGLLKPSRIHKAISSTTPVLQQILFLIPPSFPSHSLLIPPLSRSPLTSFLIALTPMIPYSPSPWYFSSFTFLDYSFSLLSHFVLFILQRIFP